VELLRLGAHTHGSRLLGRHLHQPCDRRGRRPAELSELRAGPRQRSLPHPASADSHGWQDIGTNRFAPNGQNPLVTNCGTTPIYQPNGATWGNLCEVVAPSFTRGNMPSNFFIAQRIIGANASIYKDFTIKERFKAQLRMDYYNPFKWFNWSQPMTTTMTQTNPAIFMTPGLNDFGDSTEGGPSQIHLSFRVKF
jgi:hypothetical protein